MSDGTAPPERDLRLYEKRIDAMLQLFQRHPRSEIAGLLRGAQEELKGAVDVSSAAYYDRWIAKLRQRLVEQGILTEAEIEARRARLARSQEDDV